MLFWNIYIKRKIEIKIPINIMSLNRSARLVDNRNSWKEWIKIIVHIWLIFKCKSL